MSKNMTRKGLAFGAGAALIVTGFVGAPAAAEVDDSAVSLLPRLGSEYVGLVDNVFDLKSTQSADAVSGTGDLKFLVEDEDKISNFDYQADDTVTSTDDALMPEIAFDDPTGDILTVASDGSSVVTITNPETSDNFFANLTKGDIVAIEGLSSPNMDTNDSDREVLVASATDDSFTFLSGDLDNNAALSVEDLDAGTFTEVSTISFDSPVVTGDSDGASDDLQIAFDESTGIVTISNPQDNDLFHTIEVGDTISFDGLNSSSLTSAFSGAVEVDSVSANDEFTFELDGFNGSDGSGTDDDISTEDLDAGTFVVSDKSTLDSRDLLLGADDLSKAAVHGIAVSARDSETGNYVIDTNTDADATSIDILRLVARDEGSISVTAWIDENGNGEIDSTEDTSSTRTITFVEFKDSGATLEFEQPAAGDDKLNATLTFGSDFNAESIQASPGAPKVSFAIIDDEGLYYSATSSSVVSTAGAFSDGHAMVFDDSDYPDVWSQSVDINTDASGIIDGSAGSVTSAPNGYTFVAEVIYDSAVIGAETFKSIDSENVDIMFQPAPELGENVLLSSGSLLTDSDAEFKVRSETTSALEINSTLWAYNKSLADNLKDADFEEQSQNVSYGVEYVPAGTVVNVEVSEVGSSLDSDSVISVNGEELTSGDDPIEFTTTTNSVGVASISLANSEGVAGDSVLVEYSVDGLVKTAKLTWGDPDDANIVFGVSTTEVTVEQEGSVSVDFFAYDEFGKGLSSPDYQVLVDDYITSVGGSDAPKNLSLSNGVGTLTFDDESESNGSYRITGDLQVENSSADYEDANLAAENIDVNVVSDASPAIVELDAVTGTVDIQTTPITNLDARFDRNAALAAVPGYVPGEAYEVSGTVKNANGVLLRGVEVTLSGADLGFNTGDMDDKTDSGAEEDGMELYTTGSITVVTDNTGDFAVEVRSNIAGKHVVTATSGTGSDTTDADEIDFEAAKPTEGTDLDVSISPEQVTPQGTVKVTISLKDDFGNPVEVDGSANTKFGISQTPSIKVEYNGDGIAFGLTQATNEDGLATFDVLLGIDDVDPNSVVVEYNADGKDTTTSDNYAVQASQASYGSMTAWTVDQGDGTAKVYVKFPTIGEKVRIGHQTGGSGSYETIFVKTLDSETDSALTVNVEGSYIVRTIDLVDGTNRIRVTVGDSTEVQVRYNE